MKGKTKYVYEVDLPEESKPTSNLANFKEIKLDKFSKANTSVI